MAERGQAGREPSTGEVEIALKRYEVFKNAVLVAWIAALWFPLKAATPIAEALAGNTTNVTLTVTFTLALSVALGSGVFALWNKTKSQSQELKRLRRRCDDLEGELDEARRKALKA